MQFTWDAQLRLLALTDALGQVTTLQYQDADPLKVTSVTDPFGRIATVGEGQIAIRSFQKLFAVLEAIHRFRPALTERPRQMSEPRTALVTPPLPSGNKRGWLAIIVVALAAGSVLAVFEQRTSSTVGFSLTLFAAAILGLWSGRHAKSSTFWSGAAITFLAVLTSGLIRVVVVYRSSPYEQPLVLPPALALVASVVAMAVMWGAAGGVMTYAATRIMKR